MVSKNRPFVLQRKSQFEDILKKHKELSIKELSEKLKFRSETVSRWVNYFELDGLLKSRFEGLKRMVSLK